MTQISDEFKQKPISIKTLRWLGYTNNHGNSRVFKLNEFKDVIVYASAGYFYDKDGSEEKKIILNSDLINIVLKLKQK